MLYSIKLERKSSDRGTKGNTVATLDKKTVTVKEAAKLLGVGINNAYELTASGRLRSVKIGRRVVVPVRELDAFLEREMAA